MVEQVACNSDFLASFPLYYRDSPERKKKKKTSLEEKALVAYDTYERRRERGRRSNVTRSHRRAKTGNESEGKREREKKVYFALSWHRQCARRKRRRARRRVYTYTRDEEETVNHGREEIERERE